VYPSASVTDIKLASLFSISVTISMFPVSAAHKILTTGLSATLHISLQYQAALLHYITLHYKLFIVAKVKNCKVHYGASHTTMSGYDYRNKCVFSFRRNDNSDVAVVRSRGRVFLGPAVANERSPTVTRRDGRTSRRLVDDDRRRVLAGMSAM